MKILFWLLLFAVAVALGWLSWYTRRKWIERKQAEEARIAAFLSASAAAPAPKQASALLPAPPSPTAAPATSATGDVAAQKMLFEAAHKAGEAGEPALAIQLYARLLVRYPASAFAGEARAAAAAQKKKLVKA